MKHYEEDLLFLWHINVVCWKNYVSKVSTRGGSEVGGREFVGFFSLID